MKRLLPLAAASMAALAFAGCGMAKDDPSSAGTERTIADVEARAQETRTLSSLAKIETSIAAYIEAEKKIPPSLDALVPQYLAEIPMVELGVTRHRDNNNVKIYPASVLRDGAVDGSQLRDSGRWGYVHNDRQVVVFIDCTHKRINGSPWYQARGVY